MTWRLLLSFLLTLAVRVTASQIQDDETVVFFPSIGLRTANGSSWELDIHGCVYEAERRRATLAVLRKTLGIEAEELNSEAKAIFNERVRAFLADNERGKASSILFDGKEYKVGQTAANGHFQGRVRLSAHVVEQSRRAAMYNPLRLSFQAALPKGDNRVFVGEVHLLESTGVSVISDIDDTIKISQITDRKALLRNTFLNPFQPVPGMAFVYRSWATNAGAQFHYVSASPWQLYDPLSEFVRNHEFPAGSFHLKVFRWKDESFFDLFASPEAYKRSVIEPILKRFPERRFVLVGDSGEKDPEIYGSLARRFPKQITRILIRDVTNEGSNSGRYQTCFKGLPAALWQVFLEPSEIKDAVR